MQITSPAEITVQRLRELLAYAIGELKTICHLQHTHGDHPSTGYYMGRVAEKALKKLEEQ